jgi:hypothetical protein
MSNDLSVLRPVASHRSIENRSRNHLCPSHPYIVAVHERYCPQPPDKSRNPCIHFRQYGVLMSLYPVSVLWTSVVCLWSFCKYRVLPLRHEFTLFFWIQRFIVPCLDTSKQPHPLYVVVFATRTPAYNHIIPLISIRLYRLYIFQNIAHWDITTRASKCVFKHTTLTIQRYLLDHFRERFPPRLVYFESVPLRVGVAWSTSCKHAQDTPCALSSPQFILTIQNVLEKIFVFSLLSRLSTNEILAYFAHSPIDRRHDIRRMSTYNQNMNARVDYPKCSSVQSVMEQRIERICASVVASRVSTDR